MKTIHTFPRTNGLCCVWIETGNPRRPLACRWMEDEIAFLKSMRKAPAESKCEIEGCLCA